MKKFKQKLAHKLYDLFPQKFCWADLATWFVMNKSFLELFKYFRTPKGCIIDSMDKKCSGCWCGCWQQGHHQSSFQGKLIIKELELERENKEFETNPPF